jgi:hypothetical protein
MLYSPECLFRITLPVGAVVLVVAGATLPTWGSALVMMWHYYRSRRAFQALEPLWNRLHEAFPQIMLPEHDGARRDLAFRLYRRVIEIDDGRLLLRPYMSPHVSTAITEAARARGLDGDNLRATIDAAKITAALRVCNGETPVPVASSQEFVTGAAGSDISHEAAWLAKISRAYVTPFVRELASQEP